MKGYPAAQLGVGLLVSRQLVVSNYTVSIIIPKVAGMSNTGLLWESHLWLLWLVADCHWLPYRIHVNTIVHSIASYSWYGTVLHRLLFLMAIWVIRNQWIICWQWLPNYQHHWPITSRVNHSNFKKFWFIGQSFRSCKTFNWRFKASLSNIAKFNSELTFDCTRSTQQLILW